MYNHFLNNISKCVNTQYMDKTHSTSVAEQKVLYDCKSDIKQLNPLYWGCLAKSKRLPMIIIFEFISICMILILDKGMCEPS